MEVFVMKVSLLSPCEYVQVGRAVFSDERHTKNTIHYHPLQAISFPNTLLSETILFIDEKINHQQERGRHKQNQWRI